MRLMRMLRAGQQLTSSGASARLDQFRRSFKQIWQNRGPAAKLGLAVSGGVDSMALASLCVRLSREENPNLDIHAFVVDHHLRSGSTAEAWSVARDIECKLGIEASVLSAAGIAQSQPIDHIEKIARQARYRLLGEACARRGIDLLFTGHHADDQAATVLLRLANGYLGAGLSGMRQVTSLPECAGVYGVHESGSPISVRRNDSSSKLCLDEPRDLKVEDGGVQLGRPLLTFSKNDLLAECRDLDLQWYEDSTNKDQRYTTRNSLNALLRQEVLPLALRKSRLLRLADETQRRKDLAQGIASHMMNGSEMELSTRTGRLDVQLSAQTLIKFRQYSAFNDGVAQWMQSMVSVVTPKSEVSRQAVARIVSDICNGEPLAGKIWNVRSVRINCTISEGGVHRLRLIRANPLPSEAIYALDIKMPAEHNIWTEWQLWDGRFWVRVKQVGCHTDHQPVCLQLRFMRRDDPSKMSQELSSAIQQDSSSYENRRTLPVLVQRQTSKDIDAERILALPTLGLSGVEAASHNDKTSTTASEDSGIRWLYEVHYKSVGPLARRKIGQD